MFGPVSQCWPSSNREIKQEDHSTQTPGSPAVRLNGMLPCGVAEEPRRLFYGKPDTEKQFYQLGELKKKKKKVFNTVCLFAHTTSTHNLFNQKRYITSSVTVSFCCLALKHWYHVPSSLMLIEYTGHEREILAPVRAIYVSLVLSPLSPVASDCRGLFSFYYLCVCT